MLRHPLFRVASAKRQAADERQDGIRAASSPVVPTGTDDRQLSCHSSSHMPRLCHERGGAGQRGHGAPNVRRAGLGAPRLLDLHLSCATPLETTECNRRLHLHPICLGAHDLS